MKPRLKVKPGEYAFPGGLGAPARAKPGARWFRDTSSGVLASRQGWLVDNRDDVRRVWDRVAATALDLIQNSGRLRGACDQVLADTLGTGLKLSYRPDLRALGYDEAETASFVREVEARWKRYAEDPTEADLRGKFTLHQQVDVALRHFIGYGEAVGIIDFLPPAARRSYGITTGTKFLLVPPHRLVRDTVEMIGLHSGVMHDPNGRPVAYRFKMRETGFDVTRDYQARDVTGRTLVVHVFEPWDATDVRGISVLASALRTQIQAEKLGDATLETAILQTVFAATLASPEPSKDAFEALNMLEGADGAPAELLDEFMGYFGAALDKAAEGTVRLDGSRISHLAPGEKLELHTAPTPGSQYLPFSQDLRRELARAIGVTYESFTLDFSRATYSSVRMGNASIWPVVMRRRDRIAAPIYQAVFESWLDEQIATGAVSLRGGYAAFLGNRAALEYATWQGPAKPSADDAKSAKAAETRLLSGVSTLEYECAEHGLDWRDVVRQRAVEAAALDEAGLPSPFERQQGGAPEPAPEREDADRPREEQDA